MPENLPVLYSFRRCPYAMRARMALHTSATVLEHREIELKNKPAAMLAASPKGTVPVLVLPDGRVIDESLDIMRWALAKRDPLHWWPPADQEPAALDLIAQNDGPFKQALDSYKFDMGKFPDTDEVVFVNVQSIEEMGAYVTLLEYNNVQGMVLLSELSRRRIRSIHKLIRVREWVCYPGVSGCVNPT